ncbi:Phage-related baseplate assembly protein [Halomonas sp. THAF12]|uniref:phage baseplate assembly protein V n=1 Tax=Halomonas sp. THAF12 TaxID=2587849 RepID=UPI0012A92208|nr:phage baseplate assembly protein V [Halomonas sp. THAF12]QFT84492.1 Phage-related baseplate assembly protein [Halomonas sp. THAF12]
MKQHPLQSAAELLRLIHNLIRLGTIAAVDHDAARVRVKSGELLTAWRPWIECRAGTTRDWNPPTVGEQAVLFSPGGDPAGAVVLVGLFSDAHPAPADLPELCRRLFPDGGLFEYDHEASVLRIKLPGRIEVEAPGGTSWKGDIDHQGDMARAGSYAQDGGSLTHNDTDVGDTHRHPQGKDSDGNGQQDTEVPR